MHRTIKLLCTAIRGAIAHKYYFFSVGLAVYSLAILSQKVRLGKAER